MTSLTVQSMAAPASNAPTVKVVHYTLPLKGGFGVYAHVLSYDKPTKRLQPESVWDSAAATAHPPSCCVGGKHTHWYAQMAAAEAMLSPLSLSDASPTPLSDARALYVDSPLPSLSTFDLPERPPSPPPAPPEESYPAAKLLHCLVLFGNHRLRLIVPDGVTTTEFAWNMLARVTESDMTCLLYTSPSPRDY